MILFWFFEQQLLKILVPWSPGEYLMIDRLWLDAFGVLSCAFWTNLQQCGARLLIQTLRERVIISASFKTDCILDCNFTHRQSNTVSWMLNKGRSNPMRPLCWCTTLYIVPLRVTRFFSHSSIFSLLAVEPQCMISIAISLYLSLYLSIGGFSE